MKRAWRLQKDINSKAKVEQKYKEVKTKAKKFRSELRAIQADNGQREDLLVRTGESLQ